MNTLEDAFLDSLASRMVVEDVAETKAAQTGRQMPTVAEAIGKPEQILESAKPETAAAVAKGMAQGFVGLPGDLIALARGVYELGKSGGDLDELLAGLEKPTGLPTTEDVKKFLESKGFTVGTGDDMPEKVGEFAAPGGYIKGAKSAIKATKKGAGKVKEVLETPPKGAINLAPRASQGTVKLADDLEVEIAPAERSKNFKNWFGDSKVVDEKGNPLVVYHGTGADFDEFKKKFAKQGRIGKGFYFATDPTQSSNYAFNSRQKGGSPTVMPVYLKASNILNTPSYDKSKPIDGIKYGGMYLVYEPTQIKSAIGNIGTFDPKDPNILRGAIAALVGAASTQNEESK